ncbi:MAG: S41 family peptidase [Paludibacter sp.]
MKRILFPLLCLSVFLVGCKDEPSETEQFNKYVNEWVYQNMDGLYYWNTSLPAFRSSAENPNDYFKTLKNKDDRFSAIFESYQDILNQLNGVSSSEIGFEFQLYKESKYNDNVLGVVLYVKHGTHAEKLGVKRGDIFRKINGTQITINNYSTVINYLFDNSTSSKITFSVYTSEGYVEQPDLTVVKAVDYNEHPVYMDTVYTVQNKKVGYLVYHFFTNDPGDKSLKYDLELNNAIGRFKQQNISELVVDLRYNHGGMMSSAVRLASMLVPNLTTNKVFSYTEYNQNYTNYFNSAEFKKQTSENPFVNNFATTIDVTSPTTASYPVQNVGGNLQRIFFLTGEGTASASEMVINGLKPFLPCVLIGDTTVGKNVGSTLVNDEDNKKNQWAFMPIILKYFNKDHKSDFTQGFAPDFLIEDDYLSQLGNVNEDLLAKALSQISGIQQSPAKSSPVRRQMLQSSINFKPMRERLIVKSKAIDSYLNRVRK